jgi:hypothetical protein
MNLLAGTLLVVDESLPPVAWLERPLGFFDAPQLIQCRHCLALKEANAKNYRNIKKIDRFRTTCRKCEDKTTYGRRAIARANRVKLDPALPDAVKAYELAELPAVVANSKSTLIKQARTKEHTYAFSAMWRKVAHIIAIRRQVLAQLVQASKRSVELGVLAALMQESWVVSDYVDAVLGQYSTINDRLKDVDTWYDTIGGHLPPDHWQKCIQALVFHRNKASREYRGICERMSPWEFTTLEERNRLSALDPLNRLDEREEKHARWTRLISRGTQVLMRRMYPGTAWPDYPALDDITPEWMREYNGIKRRE